MAPTPSPVVRLHRRTTVAPVAPLLSPTTCLWSVEGKPANHCASAVAKLSSIHNADIDREMARRWLDEDYDFYAPDEVARRNELYEAFAHRVAALQSTDAGLREQADVDEYIERDELRVVMEKNAVVEDNAAQVVRTKPESVPKSRAPNPSVPVTHPTGNAQATKGNSIDSKTRVEAQVPATEPKGSCEPLEKKAAVPTGTLVALTVASKLAPPPPSSPTLSQIQRQELDMVKAYLAKLAVDFTWESTASQGLEATSEDSVIGLSAYVIAYGYEKAVKKVCGVLSHESPFKAQPTVMDDGRPRPKGSPRKLVEKGVLRTPPRRFSGSPDAVLNKSREALSEELRRKKMESAASKVDA
ncbi:hypothetical protein LXA43DRAFT_1007819 [Ganoderma leucocontextum]|nr:hypothetical protein LXA43DRAFT_1007819 [Ganoderma leucocontextum]